MKSLGTRLALWYSLVSTLTLVCLFAAGYYLLQGHLIHGLDLLNATEFAQMKARLGGDHAALSASEINARIRSGGELNSVLFYLEIHEAGRSVVYRSANLGAAELPDRPGTHTLPIVGTRREFRVGRFLLDALEVRIATPTEQVHQVMDGYVQTSLILVCLILVVSVITGFALSRVALRPMRLIQETAYRIRCDNLSERIPVADVRDEISDLARLLNEMFDRLESSFNQVRRFSSEVSHELKTPLTLVRLQAEKLLTGSPLTPSQEEALQVQLEEITRLNQIIEELLFISRVEAQAVTPALRREDPRAFLQTFALDARALAEHRGMRFREMVEGKGLVDFDARWLRQVLLNLVTNALNVSPPNGLVTLISEFGIDVWRVTIEDDGPGVPEEQREHIFDRFVRLRSGTQDEKGSGLGLTISRSIISLHRGTIRAEASTRGSGLRVIFELPLPSLSTPVAPDEPAVITVSSQMD